MSKVARLKELRLENGFKQSDIADAIHTGARNIGRWETGTNEPTLSFIIALADFFQVSTDYLLGREDDIGNIILHSEGVAYSEEEKEIIRQYRALSPQFKKIIKENLKTLNDKT